MRTCARKRGCWISVWLGICALSACSGGSAGPDASVDAPRDAAADAGSSDFAQQAYLKASNTNAIDAFGTSVAISADGATLVVGAEQEASAATGIGGNQNDNSAGGAGAVYVFARTGATWTQQAYLKASNSGAVDLFGHAVALSPDGSTLVVGAPGESSAATGIGGNQNDNSAIGAGAAYVFTRAGATWSQQAYLKASNAGEDDTFGEAVALSTDGSTLVVGAYQEASRATGVGGDQADNTAQGAGAAYVFIRTGAAWSQQAYLKASNTGAGDFFGTTLALSGDGSTLAVGANQEASTAVGVGGDQADNTAPGAGAVYVFTRSGLTWSQQAYLKASNTGAGDRFGGLGLAIAGDGTTLAAGSSFESSAATGVNGDQASNLAASSGAVYVFARAGATWAQQAYLKASNTNAEDRFGYRVALSGSGAALAVSAIGEASAATGIGGDQTSNTTAGAGAVYLFARAGATGPSSAMSRLPTPAPATALDVAWPSPQTRPRSLLAPSARTVPPPARVVTRATTPPPVQGPCTYSSKQRHRDTSTKEGLPVLSPTDILDDVRRAFDDVPPGTADHNRHWINAYGLLSLIPATIRAQLIAERGEPGAGSGHHFAAASVVARACQMLAHRNEIEIGYYAPVNATYTIDGRTFEAGYQISAIYRRLP